MTRFEKIIPRDCAVALIDAIHGYTVEFAADQASHRNEYDMAEAHFKSALAAENERCAGIAKSKRCTDTWANSDWNHACEQIEEEIRSKEGT